MNAMDTKALTDILSKSLSLSKQQVLEMCEAMTASIQRHATEMDSVSVPGFGSFEPQKRMERVMAVPSTGKRLLIPPKIILTFKPSGVLKSRLRSDKNESGI